MVFFIASIITTAAAAALFVQWVRARLMEQSDTPVLALVTTGCAVMALAQWMTALSIQWGPVGPHRIFAHIEYLLAAFCFAEALRLLRVRMPDESRANYEIERAS
jgi:hypothetical protein